MAEFQRKAIPFLHKGMNWNVPVEKLADGQLPWAKNVRVLEQSTIGTAHGHTEAFTTLEPNYHYLHSISRLNILNPAYDANLARTYVLGADRELLVFQDDATLHSTALNPVWTPLGQYNVFSGNPLSVVDAQPAGAATAWKYIGDSQQMVTVGYYPDDRKGTNMARALTIGLPPPVNTAIPDVVPGGNLLGKYQWIFAYRRVPTGARSNPSAATRADVNDPSSTLVGDDGAGNIVSQPFHATFVLPYAPLDPQTQEADANVVVDVYRFGGDVLRWALVGSGPGASVFVDNTPDEQLLAAPSPPQATDASTGLTRFNLYQPFVTQDIARHGNATIQQIVANHTWQLWWTAGPPFNLNWLPGSTIYVGGVDGKGGTAFTIYQVISDVVVELAEDASKLNWPDGQPFANGQAVEWNILAGTLLAGQPLPHLWGPYGVGQSGSFVFGCGDPNSPGTLYWTNGNDPDSTDIVNNIQVTSPSEKLQTGCLYDGQPFCWSPERQFQIQPSLTVFGQFTSQEVAGAKGCWLEWSLSVQSNGLADQSVTWRGKDGIYDWSTGGGLRRLTDDLYAFFPHDNEIGFAPETLMPFIDKDSSLPENVGNIDDAQPQYHRTCWFHGMLFYDFVAQANNQVPGQIGTFSTLVWDDVMVKGWVSLDQPFADTRHPVARGIEIGAHNVPAGDGVEDGVQVGAARRGGNLKVSWGGQLYDYYGPVRGFPSRVITRAEDIGDSRAQKRWGDYWLDCTPWMQFEVHPLAGFHRCALQPVTVPDPETAITPDFCPKPTEPGSRAQFVLDFAEFKHAEGAALMSPSLGLDIRWTAADGFFAATLNQWQPSWVLKPEIISFRATDPDDLGVLGAKYFTGMNLEANTFGKDARLNVLLDANQIAQLTIHHDGQSEHPYAFTPPKAGYLPQLQMDAPQDIDGQPVTWQIYKINWIYEPWPDSSARASFFSDLGYTGAKFLQGMVVPMETGGQPASFQVNSDCGQSVTMGPVTTPDLCKNEFAFSFGPCNNSPSDPFIAHQLQIVPSGATRIWYDNIKWIWEPEPELVATWCTQPTNHDLPGWHSMRDCYIAYRGGNGAPTLFITTEYGTENYLLDYVGPNVYTRCYRVLKPQKAKWRSYRVEGCGLFRLYFKDCEVRVKAWGSTGAYTSAQPFGDLSRANGGARI